VSQTISEYVGQLIVMRCWCGIQHAVPESLRDLQRRQFTNGQNPKSIFCPLGHEHVPAGESPAERHKRELEAKEKAIAAERARHDQTRAELRETERRRRAERGAKTKLKKRAAAGVCPCCNRTFKQLASHMTAMHPEFVTEAKSE
jgi:hypothetical protein